MKYSTKTKRFLGVLICVLILMGMFVINASAQIKDTTKDVTLTIYALQAEDGSQVAVDKSVTGEKIVLPDMKPIKGVSFALYKTSDYETSTEKPDREPDFTTELSGEDGCTSIVIPGSEQGRYLVTEAKKPPYAVNETIPFLVDLPMTTPDGTDFMYNVYAYPKQMCLSEDFPDHTDVEPDDSDDEGDKDIPLPKISKKVSEDNGKTWKDLANIASISGHRAYWKVTVDVPSNVGKMKVFTVGDVLDKRLEPPQVSEVKASVSGAEISDSAYTVSISSQTITVDFDTAAIKTYKDKKIDIIFPTAIRLDEDNAVGVLIPNTATLTYSKLKGAPDGNGSDTDINLPDSDGDPKPFPVTTIESETPEVWTSEIKGFKHDSSNQPLVGAEFTLYSDKECKTRIAASTSDKNGEFFFIGLHDGTYYLKETKTPDGYQANDSTIEVTVKMTDNMAIEIVDVLNVKNDPELPRISKKVSEDNGKTWNDLANIASVSGHRAYWKVTVYVPTSIGDMKIFTVGDILDKRLEPPKVSEIKASVSCKELSSSAYKASVSSQSIKVDFDTASIAAFAGKKIDIIFPTAIRLDEKNAVGVLIPNTATLTYSRLEGAPIGNGSDTDITTPDTDGEPKPTPVTTIESETPEVWTSEIKGFKHDGDKKAISGAEFTLYSDKDCKNKIASSVSDNNGEFFFIGLHDGTYYLKETKTPDGYQTNENTIEVTVKMKDNKAVEAVDVLNVKKTNLPVTGGAGIIALSMAGLAVALLGGVFIILALKERSKAVNAAV